MSGRSRELALLLVLAAGAPAGARAGEDAGGVAPARAAAPDASDSSTARVNLAVSAALDWLVRHQDPDGGWKARDFLGRCSVACKNRDPERYGDGRGLAEHDVGVTGLALLALATFARQGGIVPEAHRNALERGAAYIVSVQHSSDDPGVHGRFGSGDHPQWVYGHAIATMALATYLPFARERITVGSSVRDAITLCLHAQTEGLGWRYKIKDRYNDTSVTGSMVLALHEARNAPLDIPKEHFERAFKGALNWLDRATNISGKIGYNSFGDEGSRPTSAKDPYPYSKGISAMTAVGVLCQVLSGESWTDKTKRPDINLLLKNAPRWEEQKGHALSTINLYYWYHATRAICRIRIPERPAFEKAILEWEKALLEALLPHQRTAEGVDAAAAPPCERGSWDPIDEWGFAGGRVYSTALGALTLLALKEKAGDPESGQALPPAEPLRPGDLARVDALRAPRGSTWTALIEDGAEWEYRIGSSEPSAGLEWTRQAFDAGGWTKGETGLGHDASGASCRHLIRTPLDLQGGHTTVYLRKEIEVADPCRVESLALTVRASDGCIAYLNGIEVARARSGKAGERRAHDDTASGPRPGPFSIYEAPPAIAVEPMLLQRGKNVLALQGLRSGRDDGDFFVVPVLLGGTGSGSCACAGTPKAEDHSRARRAYLEGRLHEIAGDHRRAAESFVEACKLDDRRSDPFRRLAAACREIREPAVAEAALREGLSGGAGLQGELWDLWYRLSTVDLKRPAKEVWESFPGRGKEQPCARASDLAWLLERLAEKQAVRIDCGSAACVIG